MLNESQHKGGRSVRGSDLFFGGVKAFFGRNILVSVGCQSRGQTGLSGLVKTFLSSMYYL